MRRGTMQTEQRARCLICRHYLGRKFGANYQVLVIVLQGEQDIERNFGIDPSDWQGQLECLSVVGIGWAFESIASTGVVRSYCERNCG